MLPILDELNAALTEVSDRDVKRAERHLGQARDGEEALGTIHSLEARRMWTLAYMVEGRAAECLVVAKLRSDSDEETEELHNRAHRLSALEAVARQLFWSQAKDDIGGAAWCAPEVGLRTGWLLVVSKRPGGGLLGLLRGGVLEPDE